MIWLPSLPLRQGDKVKMTFWEIDFRGNDYLYQWKFFPFGLNNVPLEFQKVMDQMLVGLGFSKCYINDIIVFGLNLRYHMHHFQ